MIDHYFSPRPRAATFAIVAALSFTVHAQGPIMPFQKKFGAANLDEALWRLEPMPDGNYVTAGWIQTGSSDLTRDCLIAKLDPQGDLLGAWTLGQPQFDETRTIKVLSNSDVIIYAAVRPYSGSSRRNVYVARLSLMGAGQIVWAQQFGTNGDEQTGIIGTLGEMIITSDGHILFAGYRGDGGNNSVRQGILVKMTLSGATIFRKQWTASVDLDRFNHILEVPDGYVVTGYTDYFTPTETHYRAVIAKFSTNGNLLWSNIYDNGDRLPSNNIFIVPSPDGHLVVAFNAGTPTSTAAADRDVVVMKIDQNGGFIWGRRIGGPQADDIDGLLIDHNNFISVTGDVEGLGSGGFDAFIATLSLDGDLVGTTLLGGLDDDEIGQMLPIMENDCPAYLAVGNTRSFNLDGSRDAWIMKLDAQMGDFGQCYTPNVPFSITNTTFQTSQVGSVSDWNLTSTPNLVLTPITYTAQNITCSPITSPGCVVSVDELVQAVRVTLAPNPSPGRFELRVEGPQRLVEGQLLDALGREVPLKRPLHAGAAVQQVEFDGQAKGLYLLRLVFADGGVRVVRVVVE